MEPSTHKNKKWSIKTPSGKIVHFGDTRYQDYTQHKDKNAR